MPSVTGVVFSLISIPGQVSWNLAMATGRTTRIHIGPAVMRRLPVRPASVALIFSSAASIS